MVVAWRRQAQLAQASVKETDTSLKPVSVSTFSTNYTFLGQL